MRPTAIFRTLHAICLVATLQLTVGCGDIVSFDDGTYESIDQPIICGGAANAWYHEAVVALVYNGSFWCSGTLIAPDVVLTAGHCVKSTRASKWEVLFGDDIDSPTRTELVSELLLHPSYNGGQITNDIALMRLQTPVSDVTPVPTLPAAEGFTDDDIGMSMNFAGFGDDQPYLYSADFGEKLEVDGPLNEIYSDTQIYYDMQDRRYHDHNCDFWGPCFGDSGGPAFVFRGNDVYVGSLTSYGDAYCLDYGVNTRTDAYEDWINAFVGTGFECTADADCDDSDACTTDQCIGGGCNYTPLTCDDGDPCTDDTCNSTSGCVYTPSPECGTCGDGYCAGVDDGEDCDTCPADCAQITHHRKGVVACCGNYACERRENVDNCAVDCM